jgi:leucyl aminopeptidase
MKEQGMGAILAVSQGSDEPARMVIMKYSNNPGGPTLALVGKGITFDSGGLCIKPADSMFRMYSDCAGACSVLGAMYAITKMGLRMNVVAVMALTENMPSGKAYKPGDIVKSFSGKTIEILNTDAEGRLILADALTLAKNTGADMIVDIATLTGGVVTALGYSASGVLGNDQDLVDKMKAAGKLAAENMWQLPLYDDYFAQIFSDVADMENSGGKAASTCTAAKFLEQFVDDTPWVHIDIAGTAMIERERTPYLKKPYLPKEGATGVGVRSMYHFTEMLAAQHG